MFNLFIYSSLNGLTINARVAQLYTGMYLCVCAFFSFISLWKFHNTFGFGSRESVKHLQANKINKNKNDVTNMFDTKRRKRECRKQTKMTWPECELCARTRRAREHTYKLVDSKCVCFSFVGELIAINRFE